MGNGDTMAALSRISATGLTVAAIATVTAGLTAAAGTPAAHQGYATRVAAPAGGVRCAPAWRAVPVPDPGVSNVLFGAGALTGRDVWAVGSRATVRWALSAAAPGFVFDVQVRRPGTARFVNWKTGTRLVTATFTADRGAGTYAFRARVRRVHGAGTTGYSPPVAIHLR